jgi:hypothetical protein
VWCMSIVGETPTFCGSMRNVVPRRLRAKERSQNRPGRCRPSIFQQERGQICRKPIPCQPIPCQRIPCRRIRRICPASMPHKIKQHLPPRITFLRRIRPNLSKYGFHCKLRQGRKGIRLITSLLSQNHAGSADKPEHHPKPKCRRKRCPNFAATTCYDPADSRRHVSYPYISVRQCRACMKRPILIRSSAQKPDRCKRSPAGVPCRISKATGLK